MDCRQCHHAMHILHQTPGLRAPCPGPVMIHYTCAACQTLYGEDFSLFPRWPAFSVWTFPDGRQQTEPLSTEEARTKLARYRAP